MRGLKKIKKALSLAVVLVLMLSTIAPGITVAAAEEGITESTTIISEDAETATLSEETSDDITAANDVETTSSVNETMDESDDDGSIAETPAPGLSLAEDMSTNVSSLEGSIDDTTSESIKAASPSVDAEDLTEPTDTDSDGSSETAIIEEAEENETQEETSVPDATEGIEAADTSPIDEAINPQKPETTQKPEDNPEPNLHEDNISFNTEPIKGNATINGVTVFVSAPAGSFYEGTTVTITLLGANATKAAFDITFTDLSGARVQPEDGKKVNLRFFVEENSPLLSGKGKDTRLSVYHISDNGTYETMKSVFASGSTAELEIKAAHFSEYGLVSEELFTEEADSDQLLNSGDSIETADPSPVDETIIPQQPADTPSPSPASQETDADQEPIDGSTEAEPSGDADPELDATSEATAPVLFSARASSSLEQFLDYGSIVIDGVSQDLNGPITITENSTYDVTLHFSENPEGDQFGTTLTYSFPDGFVALDKNGSFNMSVSDGSNSYQLKANYTISGGLLTVSFDPDENDPDAWDAMMAASDSEFSIHLSGKINADTTELIWSGNIISDITINPEPHDLSISKQGVFNKETGKLDYTLTITSTGSNTNVIVTDAHAGTIISFDEESGVTASPSIGSMTSSSADGFVYTIPSMSDGQTVTLTYSAFVDYENLTGTGTIDETKNTATVKSDEHPDEEEDSFNFEHGISYSSLTKLSMSVEDGEAGHKTVSWKIISNKEMLVPMAGQTITDTIDDGSTDIMTYAGTGISVVVKNRAGETVRTEVIPWDDLTNKTDSSWTYTIPSTDTEPYQYEITYVTDVDTSGLLSDTNVKNKAEDSNGNVSPGEAKIGVTGESKLDVHKEAIDVDYEHITWKVTLDVPATGLTSAMVHDSLPSAMLNGEHLVDELMLSEPITVEGLLDGETYTGPTIVENGRGVDFTFYQDAEKTIPGLRASGSARQIILTFSTHNNVEWLNQSLTDPQNYKKHVNKVRFTGNGTYAEATDYGIPVLPSIRKEAKLIQTAADGMPMYAYRVTVVGLTGDLDITDTFDNSILEYASAGNIEVAGYGLSGHVYGRDLEGEARDSNGTASIIATSTGIAIHMDESNLATHSDGKKYAQYEVIYVLKVKDAMALEALTQQAIASGTGSVTLNNTASAPEIGEDSATVESEYNAVDKELLETVLPSDGSRPYATYRIVINPEARDLEADSERLILEDSFSDTLSIDYASIIVDPPDDITYDISGNTASFNIPDGTKVTITYRAWIVGTGNLTISNEAKLLGYTGDTTNNQVEVAVSGGGSASVHSINVYKYRSGDMGTPLAGATFALYMKTSSGEWIPVTNKDDQPVYFTTDATGYAKVMGSQQNDGWTLIKGREYYLVETQSPYGYLKDSVQYRFSINDHPDYANYVYMDGDILKIRNYPSIADAVPEVKKVVSGENAPDEDFTFSIYPTGTTTLPDDYNEKATAKDGEVATFDVLHFSEPGTYTYEISEIAPNNLTEGMHYSSETISMTVEVVADENGILTANVTYNGSADVAVITNFYGNETTTISVSKQWIGPAGDPVIIHLFANGIDTERSLTLSAEMNWLGFFDNLDVYDENGQEIAYSIFEEEPGLGYELVGIEGRASTGFIVTNRNTETIDIPVRKQWVGAPASTVTIRLLADETPIQTIELNADVNWQHTFENLPKYDATDGHEIVYDVQEEPVSGYAPSRSGTVETGFTFTNTITGKVSIPVTKKWIGPAVEHIYVELLADGVKVAEAELNEAKGWQYTFTDYDKFNNGVEIVYTVREVAIEGYSTNITGDQNGFTITNTKTSTPPTEPPEDKTSVPVAKRWIGPAAESVTVELLADGVKVAETVLNSANGWKHTFANLDQYNNGVEIIYTIREVHINGYSSKITGNMSDGFVITNTNTEARNIPVEKRWVGTAAENVTIRLYADGAEVADITLNKANNWKHTFTDLPKYDHSDGHEIVYAINEDSVTGYTTSITGDMHRGFVVTNTKKTTSPPSDTPKTGDNSNMLLYLTALILSGIALIVILLVAKKKSRRRKS